ncbi:hypothetical protein WR25_13182 [Diploscapter pachys]|uniref:Uncharacterized protein n=1 Tax=Diploscapter pachys TaxID=2018661 RepID=A0A2A2K2U0_9BILA|nr:hypothetical protein WR25_13182 [Diploscapter pachys]
MKLGQMYDAHRDQYWPGLMFGKQVPPEAVEITDNQHISREIVHHDTLEEKFNKLNIDPELKAILILKIQISHVTRTIDDYIGHGKYIRSVPDSAREIRISFVLKIDTKYETIVVDNVINLVPSDPNIQHKCPNSTHFIAGIQWGVIGILMLKSKVNELNDEASIRAALKAKLAALKINPGSKKKNDDSSYPKISNKDLNIEFELFIAKEFYELSDQPKNVDEAVEFMQKLPSLVAKVSNGKGTEISYRMLHLNACRKYLSLNNPANLSFYPIADEFMIGEIVKVFDELDQSERELNDIRCDFKGRL